MHSSRTHNLYSLDTLISHTEPVHNLDALRAANSTTWRDFDPTQNLYSLDTLISHTEPLHNLDALPAANSTAWRDFDPTQSLYTKILMLCCYMACRCGM